jgi:glycosyltransferase involved in cell wall biosynthesis
MRILVLAQVFPRAVDDSMGAFLLHLADAVAAAGIETDVIAPHAPGLRDDEPIGAAWVHRFHYAPASWENLAYAGTMHEIVGHGIGAKALFVAFCLALFFKTLGTLRTMRQGSGRPSEPGQTGVHSTEGSASAAQSDSSRIILHAHWWLPGGVVGAFVSLLTRVPLVVTTHGTDVELLRRTPWLKPLARFTFSRAVAVTCGSSYLRDQLLELGVVDALRASVVPMPVAPLFDKAAGGSVNRSPGLVLTASRLTAQKSIDTLIAAVALLRERGLSARLTIVGGGPERPGLEEQTGRLGLRDAVTFLGALPQRELPVHYAECAVFVLPSIREGMGLVLAEALLCGAPVIAVNSGGVTDIVRDGDTGLLVPERDPAALAHAIRRLLDDPTLAGQLAARGSAWVRERFTAERVAAQFAQTYSQILNE